MGHWASVRQRFVAAQFQRRSRGNLSRIRTIATACKVLILLNGKVDLFGNYDPILSAQPAGSADMLKYSFVKACITLPLRRRSAVLNNGLVELYSAFTVPTGSMQPRDSQKQRYIKVATTRPSRG